MACAASGCCSYTLQALKKHGTFGVCTVYACTRKARNETCWHHSAKTKCSTSGCSSTAAAGKWPCLKDGARGICSAEGCDDGVISCGLCLLPHLPRDAAAVVQRPWSQEQNPLPPCLKTCHAHGGRGYCSLAECWTPALKFDGNCYKHTKK